MRRTRLLPLMLVLGSLAACPAAHTAPSVEPVAGTGETAGESRAGTTTSTRLTTGTTTIVPEQGGEPEAIGPDRGDAEGGSPPLGHPTDLPVQSSTELPAEQLPTKGAGDDLRVEVPSRVGTGLRHDEIRQVVRGQQGRLRSCWDRLQLATSDPSGGTVSVRFTVEPAGTVRQAEIASATIADPAFLECVRGAIRELRFPAADAPTIVTYPFRFEQTLGGE